MRNAKEEADILRHEAKTKLRQLLKISDYESDGTVERIVDCIIDTAILETAALIQEASKAQKEGK